MAIRYRNLLTPIYMGEEAPENIKRSIFLMGYSDADWFNEAIDYLKQKEFDDSVIFIPQTENGEELSLTEEIEWVDKYLKVADAVIFWDTIKEDGKKGNLLFNYNDYLLSEHFFYGIKNVSFLGPRANDNTKKNKVLENTFINYISQAKYSKRDVPEAPFRDLETTLDEAIEFIGEGIERETKHCIPKHIWESPFFERKYRKEIFNFNNEINHINEIHAPNLPDAQYNYLISVSYFDNKSEKEINETWTIPKYEDNDDRNLPFILNQKEASSETRHIVRTDAQDMLESKIDSVSAVFMGLSDEKDLIIEELSGHTDQIDNIFDKINEKHDSIHNKLISYKNDIKKTVVNSKKFFKKETIDSVNQIITEVKSNIEKEFKVNNIRLDTNKTEITKNIGRLDEHLTRLNNFDTLLSEVTGQIDDKFSSVKTVIDEQYKVNQKNNDNLKSKIEDNSTSLGDLNNEFTEQKNTQKELDLDLKSKIDNTSKDLNKKLDKTNKVLEKSQDSSKVFQKTTDTNIKNIQKSFRGFEKSIDVLEDKTYNDLQVEIKQLNKVIDEQVLSEVKNLSSEIKGDLKSSAKKLSSTFKKKDKEIQKNTESIDKNTKSIGKNSSEIQRLDNKIKYHQNEYTGGGGTDQIATRFRDTKFEVYKDGDESAKVIFNLQSLDANEIVTIYGNSAQNDSIDLILPAQSGTIALISDISGGSGGGHIIQDEGVDLTQRDRLNFIGQGFSVTDSVSSTDVEVLGSSVIAFDWYHDTVVTSLPEPTSGYFKFNNSNYSSVTEIYLSVYEKDGLNVSSILENLISGNSIVFQSSSDIEDSVLYQLNGDVISTSASVTLPVVYKSSNGSNFTSGEVCIGTLFCCGGSSVVVVGSDKEVQFNYNGELSAKAGFEYDYNTDILLAPTVQIGLSGTLIDTISNYDIDSPLEVVDTIDANSGNAAFWNYLLNDGTNFRAGRIMSCWDGSSLQFNEVTTNDIGNTSGVSFSATLSGSDVLLVTLTNSDNWIVKAKRELL